jgi:glycerol-3-phosphate dehydrogenase
MALSHVPLMTRDLSRLSDREFDLLIVGGGVHGLAAAYDAALRGLSVALVEAGDFGSGTSFHHLKTVHGGLRYMQNADLKRMRESIVERRALARLAPHLLTPLPYLMPTYRKLTRSRLAMRVAFLADALVGRDRNEGVDARLRLPVGRTMSREECLRVFPGVRRKGLTGGALWYDYQMRNADRLTLSFGLAASRQGACLANYVAATSARKENGRVTGMRVRDAIGGNEFDVRARITLNAAGAGAGRVMEWFGVSRAYPLVKATNLVTRRPMEGPALASTTNGGRMLFLVPWEGRMMAGTFHSPDECTPTDLGVSDREFDAFLAEINEAFEGLNLERDDVSLVHRGLMLAQPGRRGELDPAGHFQVRDHARDGSDGAVSVIGVKYTTARGVAAEGVEAVMRRLGRRIACRTAQSPLPGGDVADVEAAADALMREEAGAIDADVARQLVGTYGTEARDVLALAAADPTLAGRVTPGVPVIRAQVLHAVRHEMATTLTDVVVRRTPLGSAGHPGRDVADACAAVMAQELTWGEARVEREEAALAAFYAPAAAPRVRGGR